MAKLERIYTIPLRSEWLKVPAYKRSKKAMKAVREFLIKHMKSENVKLGRMLNMHVWENGIKKPPHHVKVTAVKFDDGPVRAELIGFPVEEKKVEKTEKTAKTAASKAAQTEKKAARAEQKSGEEKIKTSRKKTAKPKKEEPIQPSQ